MKKYTFLITVLVLGFINNAFSQDIKFENGKYYTLADISVTGKVDYNEQTVVTFTGLEKGQRILIPGEEISGAIKKLWKLGLFNDVNFYVNKIEGDSIK